MDLRLTLVVLLRLLKEESLPSKSLRSPSWGGGGGGGKEDGEIINKFYTLDEGQLIYLFTLTFL